jgi:HAMP domain-containing protein
MIVICEECGKKYRVDPSRIKGRAASFKCHACHHDIIVAKPRTTSPQIVPAAKQNALPAAASDDRLPPEDMEAGSEAPAADKSAAQTRPRPRTGGIGLKAKMLLLFLFVPIILMASASYFYLWQFETMSRLLVRQDSQIVTQLANTATTDKSPNKDEFASAVKSMQTGAKAVTEKVRMLVLSVLGATLLLIGIIVFIYARRLAARIKALAEVADRISLGEPEMEVEVSARDEIGELAEAIARMQDNIRLSIERLRTRQ